MTAHGESTEPRPRPRRVVDAIAYVVALVSIVPVSWFFLAFGSLLATRPADLSWRSFAFGFFSVPDTWQASIKTVAASLVPALIVLWMTRGRRVPGMRLALAAGRLGKASIILSIGASIAIASIAFERFLR